jgi:hypothetical protein
MTISPRVVLFCVSLAIAAPVFAADESGAPETIRVASTESVAAGAEGHRFAFVLIKSATGACYSVVPPGGEGMVAGDAYAVVGASQIDDTTRAEMSKGHADCKIVEVVARVAK